MPDKKPKKPKRRVVRSQPGDIVIRAELRKKPDVTALAEALLDILPTLDQETLDRLAIEGKKLKQELEDLDNQKAV